MGVSTVGLLRVDEFAINLDLENATGRRDQRQTRDHVLIVAQQVVRSAHGARGVISTEAVGDAHGVGLFHAVEASGDAGLTPTLGQVIYGQRMIPKRTRRLAAVVLGPFGLIAVSLLWSNSRRVGSDVMELAIAAGQWIEQSTQIDVLDRGDIPVTFDQLGHIGVWMTATILAGVASGLRWPGRIVAAVATLSLLSEILQPIVAPRRAFQASDVIANFTGVAVGTAVLVGLVLTSQFVGSLRRA